MNPHMIVLLAALVGACSFSAAESPIPEQWHSAPLEVTRIDLGAERIGSLRFRGGLALSSEDRRFGGLSGLEVLEDGRLLAVSDDGMWFSARIELDADGTLTGVAEPRLAAMRDEHGALFENKQGGDSEDIAQLPDGRFAVAFEQRQIIRIYDLNRDGPFGEAVRGPPLAETNLLPANVGLEAIASTADGALIVGAEGSGALWRARPTADTPAPPISHYPLEFGYALTSLDRLPDGDFVALERFYAPVIGARAHITRLAADSLEDPAAQVTLLADLRAPLVVDNFEGVSAVRAPDGGVRLYIVSDDNFSASQRTLLYAFDVVEGEAGGG